MPRILIIDDGDGILEAIDDLFGRRLTLNQFELLGIEFVYKTHLEKRSQIKAISAL